MLDFRRTSCFKSPEKIMIVFAALATLAFVQLLSVNAQANETQLAKEATKLNSRLVTGQVDSSNDCSKWARTLYYTFTAGPGRFGATFSPGRSAGGWYENRFGVDDDVCYNVTFSETTTQHRHGILKLPSIGLIAPAAKRRQGATQSYTRSKTYSLPDRTTLLMIVKVSGKFDYQIKLDGAVDVPEGPSPQNQR